MGSKPRPVEFSPKRTIGRPRPRGATPFQSGPSPVFLQAERLSSYGAPVVFVGIGYDVHRLIAARALVLGCVTIPHSRGLDGHSDADALAHAITDAILGALGEADIGHFFPNTDPRWRGAPSRVFLAEAARLARDRGARIVNIDATLLAERPKIAPYIPAMKSAIADALSLEPRRIGIKATTNELLGFIGREEGIAAMAVASVDRPE